MRAYPTAMMVVIDNRIEAARAPGRAPQQAPTRLETPDDQAVRTQRLDRVLGARWVKAAARRQIFA